LSAQSALPKVLLVSKPVAPPFHDGSVCLVRELASHLHAVCPSVMTTPDAPPVAQHVDHQRIYHSRGSFAPAARNNARVLWHLVFGRSYDLWHFVFAPNPTSSRVGAAAKRIRRVPVVQTVPSRPRSFSGSAHLLFGDEVVAMSRYTADRLVGGGFPAQRLHVIPPPVSDVARSPQQCETARTRCGVPSDAPMFIYFGDLEFSTGAQTFANAIPLLLRSVSGSVAVLACRAKTDRSVAAQHRLADQLANLGERVRFAGELDDLPALLASATVAAFPVDDLYGKVDLPYAVLEACLLQVPVVVARGGPLEEIAPAPAVAPGDSSELAARCIEIANDAALRASIGTSLRAHVLQHHNPDQVARDYEALYTKLLRG
jgi:glycosyltransferase involved in cell wall biosynthesis